MLSCCFRWWYLDINHLLSDLGNKLPVGTAAYRVTQKNCVVQTVLMVGTGKSRWHQPIGQSWYKHRIRSQWYFGLKRMMHKQCNWMFSSWFSSCTRSVVLNGKCTDLYQINHYGHEWLTFVLLNRGVYALV
ncbi:hypothetical protein HanPSC8_Chr16g0695621 [Helianthus annuus]|nr:hypothetical protein HanPSC8_Chr16g0695621 [Helianthus annuus]